MQEVKGYRAVMLTKDRIDEQQRLVAGMVSTVDVDLIGDVMIPKGCDYSRLSKSVTLHHDDEQIIGSHRNLAIKNHGVWVQFKFGDWDEGNTALRMVQDEALTALSVEFIGKDYGAPTPTETKQHGDNTRRIFRKWYLDGYSLVGKPCQPKALLESKARVNDWLEREVRAGRVGAATAAKLGLPMEPKSRVLAFASGVVARVTAA